MPLSAVRNEGTGRNRLTEPIASHDFRARDG
jgi:hypothetical protein